MTTFPILRKFGLAIVVATALGNNIALGQSRVTRSNRVFRLLLIQQSRASGGTG